MSYLNQHKAKYKRGRVRGKTPSRTFKDQILYQLSLCCCAKERCAGQQHFHPNPTCPAKAGHNVMSCTKEILPLSQQPVSSLAHKVSA